MFFSIFFKRKLKNIGQIKAFSFAYIFCTIFIVVSIFKNYPNFKNKESIKLLITVKTTFKSHSTRVRQIYDTWYQLAPESIYFISDSFDPVLNYTLQGRFINTTCGSSPDPISLGCKLDQELLLMAKINATWSCHVDDDNYVNIPALMNILESFNPDVPHYIGRTATRKPTSQNGRLYWFAIGGAGVCFSKAAIKIMTPKIINNDLYNIYAKQDGMPDDWALGFIMDTLGIKMTEVTSFLSQYDNIDVLPLNAIRDTPVLSFRETDNMYVNLPYFFHPDDDPYKFQTLHCYLFPSQCNAKIRRLGIDVFNDPKIKTSSYGTYILPTTKY